MFGVFGTRLSLVYTNMSAPSVDPGTSVVPGANNAEGSWTQIATSGNIASDIYGFLLYVSMGGTSGTSKEHLIDIGTDPAGGTSYTARISNLPCGGSGQPANSTAAGGARSWYFPLFIKSGSSVAVRIQGLAATAGTVRVMMQFFGKPTDPSRIRAGTYSETIGTVTNSSGTSFTPGNSGAEGSWVSLGTTTRRLWWWQLGVGVNNATTTNLGYFIDLAYGDASNKVIIIQNHTVVMRGTSEMTTSLLDAGPDCFCNVPAGSTIYVRGSCSGTTATGFNALAVGIGG